MGISYHRRHYLPLDREPYLRQQLWCKFAMKLSRPTFFSRLPKCRRYGRNKADSSQYALGRKWRVMVEIQMAGLDNRGLMAVSRFRCEARIVEWQTGEYDVAPYCNRFVWSVYIAPNEPRDAHKMGKSATGSNLRQHIDIFETYQIVRIIFEGEKSAATGPNFWRPSGEGAHHPCRQGGPARPGRRSQGRGEECASALSRDPATNTKRLTVRGRGGRNSISRAGRRLLLQSEVAGSKQGKVCARMCRYRLALYSFFEFLKPNGNSGNRIPRGHVR